MPIIKVLDSRIHIEASDIHSPSESHVASFTVTLLSNVVPVSHVMLTVLLYVLAYVDGSITFDRFRLLREPQSVTGTKKHTAESI